MYKLRMLLASGNEFVQGAGYRWGSTSSNSSNSVCSKEKKKATIY